MFALKKEYGDINGLAFTIRHRATICVIEGKFIKALDIYSQEEKLREKLTNYTELADCKGNQAVVHGKMGNYKKAVELFKEAISLCLKNEFIPTLIDSYVKQSKFYISYKKYENAKDSILQAYKLAEEINHSSLEEIKNIRKSL